ncbi:MAG: NUDIX domain-containing protein [Candidatus Delongbacteria bacterium]|nr:NUDIX domain-containing protein [Candidatus Delongbacteria bacterium]
MEFIKEIFHRDDLNLSGTSIERLAVRGIIIKDGNILLVHLKNKNEFKFPGGGSNGNESIENILKREILEETGGIVKEIKRKIGTVIEYNKKENDIIDFFKMTSEYYEVDIEDNLVNQNLDPWEKDLEFTPIWISIKEAFEINSKKIRSNEIKDSAWMRRETFVLGELVKI